MTPRQRTLFATLAVAGAVAAYDVVLLLDEDRGNTISSVLNDQSWAAAALGFVVGHLFTTVKSDIPRWASLASGVVIVGAGATMHPLVALGVGLAGGMLLWSNAGKEGA